VCLGWEIALVYGIYGSISVGISISIGIEDWVARDAGTRYEIRHSIIRVNVQAVAFTYWSRLRSYSMMNVQEVVCCSSLLNP